MYTLFDTSHYLVEYRIGPLNMGRDGISLLLWEDLSWCKLIQGELSIGRCVNFLFQFSGKNNSTLNCYLELDSG